MLILCTSFASSCCAIALATSRLDGKDIIKFAVVTVGPQVSVGACIDQLHIYANLVG